MSPQVVPNDRLDVLLIKIVCGNKESGYVIRQPQRSQNGLGHKINGGEDVKDAQHYPLFCIHHDVAVLLESWNGWVCKVFMNQFNARTGFAIFDNSLKKLRYMSLEAQKLLLLGAVQCRLARQPAIKIELVSRWS